MADKKEILDYLRNQQKSVEIEAKVNGINLWVLLGAIGVIGWQLLGTADSQVWQEGEALIRTVFVANACYLMMTFCGLAPNRESEVRYSSWRFSDMVSPYLTSFEGLLLTAPPLLYFSTINEGRMHALIPGALGAIVLALGLTGVVSSVFGVSSAPTKFPKPEFGINRRADFIYSIFVGACLIWAVAFQLRAIVKAIPSPLAEYARVLGIVAVFYVLILLVVRRKRFSQSIQWTYDLEMDLLLDTVSADIALRKIEYRGLGPRLQDIMNKFFDDLDRRFAEIDRLRSGCHTELETVSEVPRQYSTERKARIATITDPIQFLIDDVKSECGEFAAYLNLLKEESTGWRSMILKPHIESLAARHSSYLERAKQAENDLKSIIQSVI